MKSRLVLCGLFVSMLLVYGYGLAGKAPADEETVSAQVTEKQQIEELYQKIQTLKDRGAYDAALWDEYCRLTVGGRRTSGRLDEGGETCADATVIPDLPYNDSGNTSDNIDNYMLGVWLPGCPYGSNAAPDVVYVYSPEVSLCVDISLCGSGYDTKLWVYEDTCVESNVIACDDDGCDPGLQSVITDLILTGGHDYYIVVDGYGSSSGAYEISVSYCATPPACTPDFHITLDCAGVLINAPSLEGAGDDCDNSSGEDHIYEIEVIDGVEYIIMLCGTEPGFDTKLFLEDECCGGNLLAYDDDGCGYPPGLSQIFCVELTAGQTVYLDVEESSSSVVGDEYQLDIFCCLPPPPCPYPYRDFDNANDVCPPTDPQCSVACGDTLCGDVDPEYDEDYYELVIPEGICYELVIDVFGDDTPDYYPYGLGLDPQVRVFDENCVELYFDDDGGVGYDSHLETECLEPGTYYVHVRGWSSSVGPYILAVHCVPCECPGCDIQEEYTTWTQGGIELLWDDPVGCATGVFVGNQGPFDPGPHWDFGSCWQGWDACRQQPAIYDPNDPCWYPTRIVQIWGTYYCCFGFRVYFNEAECVCLDCGLEEPTVAVGVYRASLPCCWEDPYYSIYGGGFVDSCGHQENLPLLYDDRGCCYVEVCACVEENESLIFAFRKDCGEPDYRLPVELSSLEARAGDREVTLKWTTASETDNAYFGVLRDGTEIARVDGAGNSQTAIHYEYVDRAVVNGVTYTYSLVSRDIDGTVHEYDRTVEATPETPVPTEYALDQNYPNPFNSTTSISYSLKEAGFVTLKVYNVTGQEVATLVAEKLTVGPHTASFTAENLPSGIYVYRLEVNDFTAQKKMVFLK
jgi:hypothetical protein